MGHGLNEILHNNIKNLKLELTLPYYRKERVAEDPNFSKLLL